MHGMWSQIVDFLLIALLPKVFFKISKTFLSCEAWWVSVNFLNIWIVESFSVMVSNFLLHTTDFNGQPPNGNSPEIINHPDISVITVIIIFRFKVGYLVVAHPNAIGEKIPISLKRTYIFDFSKAHLSNTDEVSLSQNLKITKIKGQPLL